MLSDRFRSDFYDIETSLMYYMVVTTTSMSDMSPYDVFAVIAAAFSIHASNMVFDELSPFVKLSGTSHFIPYIVRPCRFILAISLFSVIYRENKRSVATSSRTVRSPYFWGENGDFMIVRLVIITTPRGQFAILARQSSK